MKDPLVHLHGHSTFSFQDGYGTPTQIVERLQALGHLACAVTDHGNVFAHVPFQKAFRKTNIKPIFGCELYVVEDHTARTTWQEALQADCAPHVTAIAVNQVGYRNLLKVSKESWENGFYYKPRISWEYLAAHQEGIAILSGCVGGWPSRLVLLDPARAHEWVREWSRRFERFYIELDPAPCMGDVSRIATESLVRIAWDLKIPCIGTADAHFPSPSDHQAQSLMQCVGIGKKLDDPNNSFKTPDYQYYCSGPELLDRCCQVAPDVPRWFFWRAIEATSALADECQVEIPKAKPIAFPDIPEGMNANHLLWKWITDGLQARLDQKQIAPEAWAAYVDRASYEWKIIAEKGFADYILAVGDVCKWMKDRDVLIMIRGSGGGCLILWLIGASETDPIRHGLSFERFYDHTRSDPPDIDIDFERLRRDEAIAYVYQKYGPAHCSQVAALSKLKAKAAVQDVCFALGIPRSEYAPLSAALDSQDEDVDRQLHGVTEPKALAVLARYPQIAELVPKLIGQCRQQSIHAAGVLVSSEPLENFIGVVLGAEKQPVAAVDKKGAADVGLLKMDFLSVNSLDIVAAAVRRLGKPISWLYALPLDDAESLRFADRGLLAGIFQLDGGAATRVAREIGIDTFDDVVAASGLCRPGPAEWVKIYKQHKDNPELLSEYCSHFNPVAASIIVQTFGILCFQEQVMALASDMAKLDWPEVHALRKGVQDKLGLDPQTGPGWRKEWSERWMTACSHQGISDTEAEFWWHSIESHGGYSFNKAHCTTYGIVGYWMLYLKAHHPAAFYEAYLQLDDDEVTMKKLIHEFRAMGGRVELLDPVRSKAVFSTPEEGLLLGGFRNIKGIGPATAETLTERAPFLDWEDFLKRGLSRGMAAKLSNARDAAGWLPQETIRLAPWFPVMRTGDEEGRARQEFNLCSLNRLPDEKVDGDVLLGGYVTITAFERDRIIFVLEDEHRAVVVRVPRSHSHTDSGRAFRSLKPADYIAVRGWWTGETLFAKEFVVIKKGEPIVEPKPVKEPKQRKRAKAADRQQLPNNPELVGNGIHPGDGPSPFPRVPYELEGGNAGRSPAPRV